MPKKLNICTEDCIDVIQNDINWIKKEIIDFIKTNSQSHTDILLQTTKTNGRILELEKWKFTITGGLIVLNLFLVPIVLWLLKKNLNL